MIIIIIIKVSVIAAREMIGGGIFLGLASHSDTMIRQVFLAAAMCLLAVCSDASPASLSNVCVGSALCDGSHTFPLLQNPFLSLFSSSRSPSSAASMAILPQEEEAILPEGIELLTQPANVLNHRSGVAFLMRNRSSSAVSALCPRGSVKVIRLICSSELEGETTDSRTSSGRREEMRRKGLLSAAGEGAEHASCSTIETRATADACVVEDSELPCATNQIPLPTADQQTYQRHEIMGVRRARALTFAL